MTAHESMNDSEPDWDALQHAGVQRFRMQIKWQIINEAGGGGASGWKNEWAWQNTYDRYFEKAAKHGIEILPFLYTRKAGSPQYYWIGEPAFQEWKEFAWTVVQRYGQAGNFWTKHLGLPQYPVKFWEVWNEPNLPMNCSAESCNGKAYGEFLVETSKTIREAQKAIYPSYTAQILFGGIYQERWDPKVNDCQKYWCIQDYLKAAGTAPGIKTAYDGLSIHPYAYGKEGQTVRSYPEKAAGVPSNIDTAYNAQIAGIGVAKPLWVTEVGWPISGVDAQHVTVSEQGGLLNETYNWIKANWATYNIRYAAWYFYKDISSDPATRWDQHAGLRDVSGWYRPSWYAYEEQTGASKWPNPQWNNENIPGGIIGDPAIASGMSSQFDLVVRGTDNALYYRSWSPPFGWGAWGAVAGGTGEVTSGPSAVSWGPNRLDIVARATNGSVNHWYWNGSWHSENISGGIVGDPAIASEGPGQLELVVRGTDNALYYRSWTEKAGWGGWGPVAGGTGEVTSGPGAVSWGPNRLDIVARATNGSINHWYFDGSWHSENISGGIVGDPAIASEGFAQLELIARGTDNALWYRSMTPTGWGGWGAVAGGTGEVTSGPSAVSWGPNRLDIVARPTNGSINHWYWGLP